MSRIDDSANFNTHHNGGTFGGDFQKIYEKLIDQIRALIDGVNKGTIRFKGAYSNFANFQNVYSAIESYIDSTKAGVFNKYTNELLRKMKILAQEDKLQLKKWNRGF